MAFSGPESGPKVSRDLPDDQMWDENCFITSHEIRKRMVSTKFVIVIVIKGKQLRRSPRVRESYVSFIVCILYFISFLFFSLLSLLLCVRVFKF